MPIHLTKVSDFLYNKYMNKLKPGEQREADGVDLLLAVFMATVSTDPETYERVYKSRAPEWAEVMLGTRIKLSTPSDFDQVAAHAVDEFYWNLTRDCLRPWLTEGKPLENPLWPVGCDEINKFVSSGDFFANVRIYTDEGRLPANGFIGLVLRAAILEAGFLARKGIKTGLVTRLKELADSLGKTTARATHTRSVDDGVER